ncbi:IPTL-CTERM sorting domain-containing protein [Pseudomonadota bacterium]
MKVKLQFLTAMASLALLGNAMGQSIDVPTEVVGKGDTAVVNISYVAGGGTTNLDFIMSYDETVVDESSVVVDCSAASATGLVILNCTVDTVTNTVRGIGVNFSPNALISGPLATVTTPTLATAATGDSTNAFDSNFSASGVVTPVQGTWTLTIAKADQTITNFAADPPNGLVGGSSTLSATASSGLPVTFGSNTLSVCTVAGNVVSYLAVGICTVTADQAGNDTYNAAPQETLDITGDKVDQTITGFAANPDPGVVNGTSALSATASSGLAVTFGSNTPAVCTVSGSTATYLTAGTCTVTGDQAGNAAYNPATQVTLNITVNKADQDITGLAANPDPGVVDGTSALSATASSGLAVTFGSSTPAVCTVAGSTVSYVAAGTCTVTADQAGDADYNAATQATLNVTVDKADQTITGLAANPATGAIYGTSTLSATASSGLAATYGSSTTAVCTVSGSTVTYVALGTCTVTADQAGDANYNAADQVSIDITVVKADQAITDFAADPPIGTLGLSATLSATGGGSGNPVTFGNLTPDVCTVTGNTVTFDFVGLCTVTADQAGDDDYNAAPQETLVLNVAPTSIPTLSQWGLIALMLLMLSIGGIVIRRRGMFN